MDEAAALENLPKFVKKTRVKPIALSARDAADTGVAQFKRYLWETLKPEPRGVWQAPAAEPDAAPDGGDFISEEALKRAPFLDLSRKPPKRK
jgi:hypothetical protein